MAKNQNYDRARNSELKQIEKYLRRKDYNPMPLRPVPNYEGVVSERHDAIIITPGTGMISANLISYDEWIEAGLHTGGASTNIGTFTPNIGLNRGTFYTVNADNQGAFADIGFKNVSSRDQIEFSVWIKGHTAAASGNTYDYLLCIGDTSLAEEWIVVRFEPDAGTTPTGDGELRLYPNYANDPTNFVKLNIANWSDTGAWRHLVCTIDYAHQEFTLNYDGVDGIFVGTTAMIIPVAFDTFTVTSFFADNANANNGYHDFQHLYLGSIQAKSVAAGSSNSFETIACPAGTDPVADSSTDTLTLTAGAGISITGDAATDTIAIANTAPNVAQNLFETISCPAGTSPVADTTTDTLTLLAGASISITGDAAADSVTIAFTGSIPIQYWQRIATVLSPLTAGDDVTTTGLIGGATLEAGVTGTAGQVKIWDGSANFTIIEQPATAVNTTLRLPAAAPNVADILAVSGNPGAGLYQLAWVDPVENGQDITGNMATDTATIDATYNDGAGTLTWDVIKQMSITSDASGLKLSGDAAAPGGRQYYGTNAAGTKGFYGYGELGIPADTDTDNYSICFPASCAAQYNAGTPPTVTLNYGTTLTTSDLAIGPKMGIPVSGTATYLSVYISRWTKSIDIPTPLVDTIQVRLYVDGVAASYWETSQGITGGLGGALNNDALTASTTSTSHYVQIFAKISTQGGNADTIIIEAAIMNVNIT